MKYFALAVLILHSFQGISQCCPYINGIEVIPATPTTTDNIKIVTTVATPNLGQFISSSHTVASDTIFIEACYYSGLATAIQVYTDTLSVGTLPAGNHVVHFTAYQSTDTLLCTYSDTSTSTFNFSVNGGIIANAPEHSSSIGVLYPYPSDGNFTIALRNDITATHIQVSDVSGKLMTQLPFTGQFSLELATGSYYVRVFNDDTLLGIHRLSIR